MGSEGSEMPHTDSKPLAPKKPVQNPYSNGRNKKDLPREAKINIVCDGMASDTMTTVIRQKGHPEMPPTSELPYAGSKALLKIGTRWVTLKYKRAIRRARSTDAFRKYCCEKYG